MFKSTIDSVLSSITKKISKLRSLAAEHHNNHLIHNEEIVIRSELSKVEADFRDKAHRIADRLEELLK